MPFLDRKKFIEEGDLVLVYVSRTIIKPIYVKSGEHFNTRFGSFPHDSMIGLEFGSQITTPKDRGFVYLLQPTPELWTMSLPHRTQIVYSTDSSYILQRLDVKIGSKVIEAGTGSGSFTHAFARTVNNEGNLFTFEFHETRYEKAKEEFLKHGLNNTIITHRDVCLNGFQIEGINSLDADTIFLDLPSPWEAIPHLKNQIAINRKVGICCFSPCFEQVVKTVECLQNDGWIDIELTETQGRLFESHKTMKRDVDDAIKRLKYVKEKQREGLELIKAGKHPRKDNNNDSGLKEKDYGFNPFGRGKRIIEGEEGFDWFNVTRLESEVKTHTSYLVFASKMPEPKRII
ncbi:tRNA (adenine-N(1)-)-methyltransferase catalytic subunit trm61 [Pichia californica]|uniref:tRNA (adenine(58)-N(1))-methyltransferase catalytic subunit TRM61 n=1 Tax=Pichia californica TaxID=460514 RepID=A0A9P6WHP5_9ASCO|nr:tRNA (adenine-N(1)-)-methyltransferase catalytic subunit trm61 [[Candida] californica]KAG0687351.1 tRNA (adenine-N(1)-)-methyltransferase catalytic subunit trm61 [[Candida] californica]